MSKEKETKKGLDERVKKHNQGVPCEGRVKEAEKSVVWCRSGAMTERKEKKIEVDRTKRFKKIS